MSDLFGVDLSASEFEIEQSDTETDYEIRDRGGTVLLRARRESPRAEWTFEDSSGGPVFTVTDADTLDVSGDYAVVDETTERPVVGLAESSGTFHENWTVENTDGGTKTVHVGGVELPSWLDWLVDLGGKLSVADSDGNVLGNVSKRSTGDRLATVHLDGVDGFQRQAVVAATLSIPVLGDD